MNEAAGSNSPQARKFQTTHWSLIAAASADSRAAMEELCSAYWFPLHSHLVRLGFDNHETDDLIQAFFVRLLDKRLLDFADQSRGRFRTFLLTALRRFVVNEWKHEHRLKRGGTNRHVPLDPEFGDGMTASGIARDMTPDRVFEREWAMVVLQRAFRALEAEQQESDKKAMFESLAPWLSRDSTSLSYDELADRLDMKPAALRMRVSRMRQRLGELIREEIRKTVGCDGDVDDEIGKLFQALRA